MTENKQIFENMTKTELVAEAVRLRKKLEERNSSGQISTNDSNESGKSFLKRLNQHSPTGIFHTDSKGQFTFANQRWLQIFDFMDDNIQSVNWTKAVCLADMEMVQSSWAHSISQIVPLNMEFVCRHKNGEECWVYWQSVPEFDENGAHTGFIGSCTDISTQKEKQNTIEDKNIILETVFRNVPVALVLTNLNREITMINPGAKNLLGYEPDEILGHIASMLYANQKDFLEQGRNRYNLTANEDRTPHTNNFRRKDGSIFPAEISGTPVLDLSGSRIGFLSLIRDITERLKNQQMLEESEARAKDFADTASDWFWEADRDLRFTYITEKYEDISGITSDEMMGKTRRELIMNQTNTLSDKWKKHLQTLDNHHDYNDYIYSIHRKDGTTRYASSSGKALFDTDDTFIGYRGVGSDITEKMEYETTLLKAKEDAEQANRSKSEFLSVVSHELRTPLTSIQGSLGLVLGGAVGAVESDIADMVTIAYKNSERLTQLINDILDLEKIQSGKLIYEMGELDAINLIERSVEANKHYADSFNVKLIMDAAPHKGAMIIGDLGRLMQVMDNFLSNAIKFSPEGETVSVSLKVNEGRVRISIQDKGPGIPKSFHSKLFLAFTQADGSDNRAKGGTGLGLGIAKSIVERHDGHIYFVTELGKGTTFHIDLRLLYQS